MMEKSTTEKSWFYKRLFLVVIGKDKKIEYKRYSVNQNLIYVLHEIAMLAVAMLSCMFLARRRMKVYLIKNKKICQPRFKKNIKQSRISEFLSKGAALHVLSGFIVLKIIESMHSCKKL